MRNEGWSALAHALDRFITVRLYRQERASILEAERRRFEANEKQRQFENDLEERKYLIDSETKRVQREADQALADLRGEQLIGEQFENKNAPLLLDDERRKTQSEIDENKASAGASRASAGAAAALQKQRENDIIYDDPAFKIAMEALGVPYEGQKGGTSAGRENINNQLWEAAGEEIPEGLESGTEVNNARIAAYQRLKAGAYPDAGIQRGGTPAINPAQMDSSIARVRALTGAIRAGKPYVDPFQSTKPSFGDVRGGGSTAGSPATPPATRPAPQLAPPQSTAPDPVDDYIRQKSNDRDFNDWYNADPVNRRKELSDWLRSKGQ